MTSTELTENDNSYQSISSDNFIRRSYHNQDVYIGELNNKGLKHGLGMLRRADKITIIGCFTDGVLNGPCIIETGHLKYIGEVTANEFDGVGVMEVWNDESFRYIGQFKKGRISGYGRMVFSDGTRGMPVHEGLFEDGDLKTIKPVGDFVSDVLNSAQSLEKFLRAIETAAKHKEVEGDRKSSTVGVQL